jgi:hypothetical protein
MKFLCQAACEWAWVFFRLALVVFTLGFVHIFFQNILQDRRKNAQGCSLPENRVLSVRHPRGNEMTYAYCFEADIVLAALQLSLKVVE